MSNPMTKPETCPPGWIAQARTLVGAIMQPTPWATSHERKLCDHLTRALDSNEAKDKQIAALTAEVEGLREHQEYLTDLLRNTNVNPEAYEERPDER